MSNTRWISFVMDMLEAIEKIENYIENLNYEEFSFDEKTKDAVVRNLEVLGEAANKVPKDIQEKYKEIPWSQIIGLRHRLIHGYFAIDYKIVWFIITEQLPELKEKIKEILK